MSTRSNHPDTEQNHQEDNAISSVKELDRRKVKSSRQSTVVQNDVVTLAENRIRRDGHLATRGISCSYHEGVLMLRGCVPTYYLKQVAQTVVMEIDGVEQVDNRIEVGASAVTREVTGHDQEQTSSGVRLPR